MQTRTPTHRHPDPLCHSAHNTRKRFEIFIGLVEVRRRVSAKFYAVLRSAGPTIARTTSRKTNGRTARSFRCAKRGVNVNERSTRFSRLPTNNSSTLDKKSVPHLRAFSRTGLHLSTFERAGRSLARFSLEAYTRPVYLSAGVSRTALHVYFTCIFGSRIHLLFHTEITRPGFRQPPPH